MQTVLISDFGSKINNRPCLSHHGRRSKLLLVLPSLRGLHGMCRKSEILGNNGDIMFALDGEMNVRNEKCLHFN